MRNNILKEVRRLVKKYPNDMELGNRVRQLIWGFDDKWRVEQFNRNRNVKDQVSSIEEMEKKVNEISNS
jgi:hypothetical protein